MSVNDGADQLPTAEPTIRASFEYEGDQVRLVDVVSVEKRLPESAPLGDRTGTVGNWVEFRGSDGVPLYRRDLSPTLFDGAEVVPEYPGGEITRSASVGRGAFSVLLPLAADADHVAVVGTAGAPGTRSGAQEMVRVEAAELRRRTR